MKQCIQPLFLTLLIIAIPGAHADIGGPSPEATRIIEEFGLREAAQPISEYPGWNPRRVVVSLPEGFTTRLPGLEKNLKNIAGDIDLYIDRSANFVLTPEVLVGTDAVLSLCNPVTMGNASASLLWFHNYSVGIDRCSELPDKQIDGRFFSNSKRLSGPAIAEHSIAMMLSLAQGLPAYSRAGKWDRSLAEKVTFGEINRKTMLVVGLGGIGSQIAWRAHGLGMRVLAIRNSSREGPEYVDQVGLPDELHELAARADVVVNALPLTEKTRGIFNKGFFAAVKPGAIFLSVGRGQSTVTADLVEALQSGHIHAAGLDVTDPEPLPPESPLWQMDNVLITPHVSSTGQGSAQRIAIIAAENLRRYLAGEPLLNLVDMQAGY